MWWDSSVGKDKGDSISRLLRDSNTFECDLCFATESTLFILGKFPLSSARVSSLVDGDGENSCLAPL